MKKLFLIFISAIFTVNITYAAKIDKVIKKSNINRNAISISVKDISSKKVVYELNSKKPMIPASTLKVVTYSAVLNELGNEYKFTTELYKNSNNELFLKLGADPFLQSSDIKKMLRTAKYKKITEPKSFKIDDTILDNVEWGEGWQWDDDLNPLMPKFSSYNLDDNLLKAEIEPTQEGSPAEIKLTEFYPVNFINLTISKKDADNRIKLSRNNSISPDMVQVNGSVNRYQKVCFPVNYTKRYFIIRLEEIIRATKLGFYGKCTTTILPKSGLYLVDKITNPINKATVEVMKNSNNMVAETTFKIAGGHYTKSTGTIENAVKMLKSYCDSLNINYDDIKIVDGSGVSKNNLVTADFMTSYLLAQQKNLMEILMIPGEGTLANRMLYFTNNLHAKTGTLSDVSAITGFITTKSGKSYAFDIMINDAKSNVNDKKMLEEYILRTIQTSY